MASAPSDLAPPPYPATDAVLADTFIAAAAAQEAADKWKTYSTSRRFGFRRQPSNVSSGWSTAGRLGSSGSGGGGGGDGVVAFSAAGSMRPGSDNRLACLGLSSTPDEIDGGGGGGDGVDGDRGGGKGGGNGKASASQRRRQNLAQSRALIQYFSRLGESMRDDESVDLRFVDSLLKNGADVNCRDKVGFL